MYCSDALEAAAICADALFKCYDKNNADKITALVGIDTSHLNNITGSVYYLEVCNIREVIFDMWQANMFGAYQHDEC
jgi:protocatechuate 3,4-dioxygenase beta subunit